MMIGLIILKVYSFRVQYWVYKEKVENMKSSASSRVLILRKYRYIKIGIEEVNCWINKYF